MINDLDIVQWAYLLDPCFQLVNTAGKPLTEGYIEVYYHGTRTKYYCAADFDGTLHPFQIPLDSLGSNIVLASPDYAYDVYVYNKFGSLVMSRYNVTPGLGGGGGGIPGSDLPEHWLGTDGEAINIASDAVNVCLPLPVSGSVDYEGEFVDHFDDTTLYLNEGMYIVEAVIQFTQASWDLHNSLNNLKIDTGDGDSSYYWQEDVSGPESNQNVHERKVTFIRKVTGEEPYPFYISPSVGVQLNDVKIRRLNIVKLSAGGTGGGSQPMYKPGPGIAVDDEGVISVTGMQPVSGMNEYVTNITYNNDVTEIFNEIHNVTGDITNIYNEIQSVTGDIHEYTAGSGIIIEDDVISIDPSYIPTATGDISEEELQAVTSILNDKIDAVSAAVPEAQVNADWNATEGKAEILNKPDLSVYATKDELQEVSSNVVSHDELQSVTSVIENNIEGATAVIENTIEGVSSTIIQTIEGATSVIENTIEGVSTTIVNEYTGDIESVTAVLNDKIDAVSAAVPEAQVNADWNATEGKAEILNKPDLSVYATKDEVQTVTGVLQDELMSVSTTVSGIIADQVQSDWDEDDTSDPAYIKNKPEEIPLVAGENIYIERVQDTLVISASSVDLSPYATNVDLAGATAQLESEIQTVSGAIPDVSEFATRDEVYNATSVIENTIESVSTVIQNEIVTVSGEIPDISNLATKDELQTATGDLDAKIDAVSGAVPEAQVNADWNATEGKAEILNKPDLTVYATKSEVETATGDLNAKIDAVSADIPDSEEVEFEELDVDALVTDAELASATSVIENTIESVSTVIQNEISTVTGEIPDVSNLATKDELESASGTLDAKIDAVSASIPEAQVQSDWTETATGDPAYIKNKPAEYDLVAGQNIEITTSGDDVIINAVVPPVTGFATEEELQTVSSAIPDISNLATKDELQTVSSAIPDISDLATKDEVNTVAEFLEQDIQTVSAAIPELPEEEEVEFEELDLTDFASVASVTAVEADVQTVSSAIPDVSNLATKAELQTATGNLDDKIDTVSGAIVHYQGASGVVVDGDTVSLDEPLMIEAGQGITFTAEGDTITISADVPTVTGFATEEELQAVSSAIPDVSNLATKTEVEAVSAAIPELPQEEEVEFEELDLTGYASIASVTAVEADIQTVSSAVDAVSASIPDAQVNADWDAVSGKAEILNKPDSTNLVAGSGISIVDAGASLIISATGGAGPAAEYVGASGVAVSGDTITLDEPLMIEAGSGITFTQEGDSIIISSTGAVSDSDIFVATYNVTPFADVEAAYIAGKAIVCRLYADSPYLLTTNTVVINQDSTLSSIQFKGAINVGGTTGLVGPLAAVDVIGCYRQSNIGWTHTRYNMKDALQSDWNQTESTKVDYIKNKPDLSVYATNADLQIVSAAVSGSTEYTGASGVVVDGDTITLDEPLMIEAGSGITFTASGDDIIISAAAYTGASGIAVDNTNKVISWMNTAGITDIQIVSELPASPDAHTMYLIQET